MRAFLVASGCVLSRPRVRVCLQQASLPRCPDGDPALGTATGAIETPSSARWCREAHDSRLIQMSAEGAWSQPALSFRLWEDSQTWPTIEDPIFCGHCFELHETLPSNSIYMGNLLLSKRMQTAWARCVGVDPCYLIHGSPGAVPDPRLDGLFTPPH